MLNLCWPMLSLSLSRSLASPTHGSRSYVATKAWMASSSTPCSRTENTSQIDWLWRNLENKELGLVGFILVHDYSRIVTKSCNSHASVSSNAQELFSVQDTSTQEETDRSLTRDKRPRCILPLLAGSRAVPWLWQNSKISRKESKLNQSWVGGMNDAAPEAKCHYSWGSFPANPYKLQYCTVMWSLLLLNPIFPSPCASGPPSRKKNSTGWSFLKPLKYWVRDRNF